jgi:hypothetical protein
MIIQPKISFCKWENIKEEKFLPNYTLKSFLKRLAFRPKLSALTCCCFKRPSRLIES